MHKLKYFLHDVINIQLTWCSYFSKRISLNFVAGQVSIENDNQTAENLGSETVHFAGTEVVGIMCCPGFSKESEKSINLQLVLVGVGNPFPRVSCDF